MDTDDRSFAADLLLTGEAPVALTAADERVHRDTTTWRDNAGELVAHDQWGLPERRRGDAVQLAPADPTGGDVDEDLAGLHLGSVDIEDLQRPGPRVNHRAHLSAS
jgi:hypothetical protein